MENTVTHSDSVKKITLSGNELILGLDGRNINISLTVLKEFLGVQAVSGIGGVVPNEAYVPGQGSAEAPAIYFSTPGTYTGFNGAVVESPLAVLSWDGSAAQVMAVPIPPAENKIETYVPGETCLGGTNPDQRIHNGQIWSVKPEVVSTTEEPGTGTDWKPELTPVNNLVSEDVRRPLSAAQGRELNNKISSIATVDKIFNVVGVTQPFANTSILYQSSLFSGWSGLIPAFSDFDAILLKLKSWDELNPVTKLRVVIRLGDINGVTVADKTIDVQFPDHNTEIDVPVVFDSPIENPDNLPMYLIYATDGHISLRCRKFAGAGYDSRYSASKDINVIDFTLPASAGELLIYAEFGNTVTSATLSNELMDDITSELKPQLDSATLAGEALLKGFNMMPKYNPTPVTWYSERSTFSSWGGLFPAVRDFNSVQIKIRYWDTANPVTKVRVLVRKGGIDGDIIADQTFDIPIGELVEHTLTSIFTLYENAENEPIWVEWVSNGNLGRMASDDDSVGQYTRYKTSKDMEPLSMGSADDSGDEPLHVVIGMAEEKVMATDDFVDTLKEQLEVTPSADSGLTVLLPREVYLTEGLEHNMYFDNFVIPEYGDRIENYQIQTTSARGRTYDRYYRFTPSIGDAGGVNFGITVKKGREILKTISSTMRIAATNAANGVTRKVLFIGDSTIDGGDVNIPLKAHFDTDVMNVEFVGTRGAAGLKHEGRGGWTINDYATYGRSLFRFNVTSIPTTPSINDIFTNNGSTFKVVEINLTSGTGYISTERTSGSNDPVLTASTLVGNGYDINYDSAVVESANPFWNDATSKFDFAMYLTNTGQTLSASDWVFFQLGINDVFGQTSLESASAKVDIMYSQLMTIIDNIQETVPDIRIGVSMTIPPAASQDAFASNYANSYYREMYFKTGWLTWNKKLLGDYDTAANVALNRYLVPLHLNLDTVYNFPSVERDVNSRNSVYKERIMNNGVHPDTTGNAQIADTYIGVLKYFG